MKKVLTIGSAMQDLFLECELSTDAIHVHTKMVEQSYISFAEGAKVEISAIERYIGGGGLNSAVSFARLGYKAIVFAAIGDDELGRFIQQELTIQQVSIDYVQKVSLQTGMSFIIPCPSGNRAVLVYRAANKLLHTCQLPNEVFINLSCIYVASLSGESGKLLPVVTQKAREKGIKTAVNLGTSQLMSDLHKVHEALSYIDILILNTHEAVTLLSALEAEQYQLRQEQKQRMQHDDLPELLYAPLEATTTCFSLSLFFARIHEHGPHIVVVTNGAEGVYASSQGIIYFHPSVADKVVSTTGAGDSFSSAFVAWLIDGHSIADALRVGVLNSASVLLYVGTQTGLLKKKEIETRLMNLDKTLLRTFS